MQIADETAVLIHYSVTSDSGDILDSSSGEEPLAYIHGQGDLVPGLEKALLGKVAGDRIQVVVSPGEGYGEHDPDKIQIVPRDAFDEDTQLEPGMRFQAESDEGDVMVEVTAVQGDEVTVDANHPFAGKTLHFDVQVVAVREATEEELAHGHIHGPEGHDHH